MTGFRPLIGVRAVALLILALAAPAASPRAPRQSAGQVDREKLLKVKAAYLFNFAKFVTWPASAFKGEASEIVIGVLGDDPFGETLERTIEGKEVLGRKLAVRRFSFDKAEDRKAAKCTHVLYVAESENKRWGRIRSFLADADTLVVGETARFAELGGMVAFVLSEGRVVFHMNRAAIEKTKLEVSSKLYKLAPVVHTELPPDSEDP